MSTYWVGGGFDTVTPGSGSVVDGGDRVVLNGQTAALGTSEAFGHVIDPTDSQHKGVIKLWTHIKIDAPGVPPTTIGPLQWLNSSDLVVLDVVPAGAPYVFKYWNGSAFVEAGAVIVSRNYVMDVYIHVHSTLGEISVYLNGTKAFQTKGIDTSGMMDVAKLRMKAVSIGSSNDTVVSQGIMASYNTIGHTVRNRVPNANITLEWDGSYTSVDGSSPGDTDAISTNVVGALALFDASALPETAPGNVIKSVAVAARIRTEGEQPPTGAKAVLQIGGQNFVSPTRLVVGPGFDGAVTCFDLNPATGSFWTSIDETNGAFGLVSEE